VGYGHKKIVVFSGRIEEEPPTYTYTLSEAVDNNVVKAEITGIGVSSGDSINLELTRLTPNTAGIKVPTGTVLLASGTEQNMVVYKVREIPEDTNNREVPLKIDRWRGEKG